MSSRSQVAGRRSQARALDVVVASVGLVVTAPLLLIAVVAIRLESRGSAIFRQRRVGLGGEAFELYKLRTMAVGSDRGPDVALSSDDPRITRVGAFLRRYSLDELPNLVNVLRGEMAIVGPRPTIQSQVDRYTEHQRRRLEVKPGLTGWAQVNGRASLSGPSGSSSTSGTWRTARCDWTCRSSRARCASW